MSRQVCACVGKSPEGTVEGLFSVAGSSILKSIFGTSCSLKKGS